MADPFFASVVLLAVNDNAADGTTTFVDQSTSAKTITTNGGAVYDDAQAPTGMTTSCLLDGSGDSLSLASSADFGYGTGDFTIEWFPKYNVATGNKVHIEQRALDNDVRPLIFSDGTNILYFVSGAARITGAQPANFQHMAICRSGTTTKMFKAGTQLGSDYSDSNNYPSSILKIGASKDAGADFNGWIGNVRITKGVARYTADFTPPSLPFPITAVDPPVAAFSGTPLSGTAPLTVTFTDASTNTPTSWLWEKNDGSGWVNFDGTPTAQNPSEDFAVGTWSVRLTATNAAGSDAETKTDYITADAPPPPPADEPTGQRPSGGKPAYSGYETRKKTKEEIRREREDYGIIPRAAEIIEAVAERQAADYRQDEQQRLEELTRELELERLEFQSRYLERLNERRAALIIQETARLIQLKLKQEEEELMLLMMAAVI